jgi:hypothetical protein
MIPSLEHYIAFFNLPPSVECIGIGQFCRLRKDNYRHLIQNGNLMLTDMFWIDFYRFFGMDPIIRLRDFEVTRIQCWKCGGKRSLYTQKEGMVKWFNIRCCQIGRFCNVPATRLLAPTAGGNKNRRNL